MQQKELTEMLQKELFLFLLEKFWLFETVVKVELYQASRRLDDTRKFFTLSIVLSEGLYKKI